MKIYPQEIANIRFARIIDLISLHYHNLKIKIDKNDMESFINQAKKIIVEYVEEVNASIESEK